MARKDDLAELREDLGSFFLALNPGFDYADFQQEIMVPALHRLANREIRKLAILMPPGHSKTDLANIDFSAWMMGRFPKQNILNISYGDDLAKNVGRKVRNRLKAPLFQKIFPECVVASDQRAANHFATTLGGEFYTAGFSGSIYGKRANGIIIDDALKNAQEAKTFAESRYDAYKGIIKSRLRPDGWILQVMTRLARNDYIQRVIEGEPDYEVIRIPAYDEKADKYIWEDYYGREYYEERKRDRRSWATIYMQDPDSAAETGPWFSDIPLPTYEQPPKPKRFPAYMIVDPALSKHARADRTSIMVLCPTHEKKILLADWTLDRLDPDERTAEIIRLIRKWGVRRMIYEEYGLSADVHYLKKEFRDKGIGVLPEAVGRKGPRHQLSKEDRIRGLIPTFRDAVIVVPEKLERTLLNGEKVDLMEYFRDQEYLIYAGEDTTNHDEGLDTLSRIHDPELLLRYPERPMGEDETIAPPNFNIDGPGSWESHW
jgi:hypothetical protein